MPDARAAGNAAATAPDRTGTAAGPGTTPGGGAGPDGLRVEAEAALRSLVGSPDARLREDQWTAIEALVSHRRRALVVQRTGWGKSAVYFVATALLRARGSGPTVIVSPLLALMRDQVSAASRAGIRAVTINSANVTEWEGVHAAIAAGEVDVLLCSPERLNNPAFRDEVLPRLAASAGLVVIDEAHCISDWGHDFRPDYRRIRTLIGDLPAGIPVLATTATANARVSSDVAEQLGVQAAGRAERDVLVLRGSLDRPSLHLGVLRLPDQATRIAWLAENLPRYDGSGIVYALTVSAAQQVTEQLRAAGLEVRSYTGQTDPAEREQLESDLKENRVKALVATSALGMGFDKPDLAFVIHLGAPSSPIAYYQQVGRAGRGVDRADVVLLPGREDADIWAWFGSMAFPPEASVRQSLAALEAGGVMSTARLETHVDLRRNRLEMMLKVLDVDGALRRVKGGWETTGQAWEYDRERYARVEEARAREQAAMLAYERLGDDAATGLPGDGAAPRSTGDEPALSTGDDGATAPAGAADACRMAFLRAQLDDPDLAPGWRCGRCDLCGGLDLPAAPGAESVSRTRTGLDRPGIEVTARRQWPTGMDALGIELRGKIGDDERAETGRAVGRLDGLGWSVALRELFDLTPTAERPEGGPRDGELPPVLRGPVQQVLEDWLASGARAGTGLGGAGSTGGAGPVEGVVLVESASRPSLVRHLAAGVAHILGVKVVGSVAPAPHVEAGRHDINSAQRLAGVHRRLHLDLPEATAAALPGRHLVLVDDYTDSGWTITVAARLLRQAGAAAVSPFVLAQR
ncbi:RecQ family ATP-dependent DNA helicase [Georgenia wangjunii]|uniref:RecQ family ATP-dependent DNA helicase n=1 Tax=Georgenia wangjunii TaxID=3117730 RepID=UPI003D9C44EB